MVGRGTRIHEATKKYKFWLYDYTGVTDLFGTDFITKPPGLVAVPVARAAAPAAARAPPHPALRRPFPKSTMKPRFFPSVVSFGADAMDGTCPFP
jgi:hypothetical protein